VKKFPKDIKSLVTIQYVKRLILAVAWFILLSFSIIRYRENLSASMLNKSILYTAAMYIITIAIPLTPIIALAIRYLFIDNRWSGEIVDKTYRDVYPSQNQMLISYSFFNKNDSRDSVTLKIKTSKGIKRVTYVDNFDDADSYHNVGDSVIHYRGMKYLRKTKTAAHSESSICVHCGSLNPTANSACSECNHSLICS
jgi:hypothetical protein